MKKITIILFILVCAWWIERDGVFWICKPQPSSSCTQPRWGTIAHGASVTAYYSCLVACWATCYSQTRTCNNGTDGGIDSFCSLGSWWPCWSYQ